MQTAELNFLENFNLDKNDLAFCDLKWEMLQLIASDYREYQPALESAAQWMANRLQSCADVHSVRWRVKNTESVIQKIVRKRKEIAKIEELLTNAGLPDLEREAKMVKLEASQKWKAINENNYYDIITDLVGVRALHIFQESCVNIDKFIHATWKISPNEDVVIYTKESDFAYADELTAGSRVEKHEFGYRSIHYIVQTTPEKRLLNGEIQVRTIFQEGWSEIDHAIKYPNGTNDEQIDSFLMLFSTLAGSADAMGTFVKGLVRSSQEISVSRQAREAEHAEEIRAFEESFNSLQSKLDSYQKEEKHKAVAADIQGDVREIRKAITHSAELRRRLYSSHGGNSMNDITLQQSYLDAVRGALGGDPRMESIRKSLEPMFAKDDYLKAALRGSISDQAMEALKKATE